MSWIHFIRNRKLDHDRKLSQAVERYYDLQSRRVHPAGRFDNAQRWTPTTQEREKCCDSIRTPTRNYPYSLMVHCRSISHVAIKFGIDESEIRRAYNRRFPPKREGGDMYYKMVAQLPDGRLVSVYDGETEYKIGQVIEQHAKQNHRGGIYVYRSIAEAQNAEFPPRSALPDLPRICLRVNASGQYCVYDNGKLAFSKVIPIEIVS